MTDPYRINVARLLRQPGSARRVRFDAEMPLEAIQARLRDPVKVDVVISSVGVVSVRGTVAASLTLICNRCLREWPEDEVFDVEGFYADDADDDHLPIDEGWLDLEPSVRAAIAIELPTAPLCSSDCRGLCPTCGTDLNEAPCSGHEDEPDSPFAVLQHLLDQD